MKNYSFIFLAVLILAILPDNSRADDDHIKARELLETGKIMSLEMILKKIHQNYPGKILEVELESEYGKIVYDIEVLSENGVVIEIYIDARNGKILSAHEDD